MKCTCKNLTEIQQCTNEACPGWCGDKTEDMDEIELLDIMETDVDTLYDGQYLCLVQPSGWPTFLMLERFGNNWIIDSDDKDAEDWKILGFVRLPDTGEAANYLNAKKAS